MFYIYAVLATIFYALNNTLMADVYRKMTLLWAVTLRSFGIAIAMSPMLFFVSKDGFTQILPLLPAMFLANLLSFYSDLANVNAFKKLPIGIACAFGMSFAAIFSLLFSYLLLGESLSIQEIVILLFILVGIISIGFTDMKAEIEIDVKVGVLMTAIFGFLVSFAYIIIAIIARASDPILAGYCWESFIGLIGAVYIVRDYITKKERNIRENFKQFPMIILIGLSAAFGAATYALAVESGPIAIVAAILGTMMVANSIFALVIKKENLTKLQWSLVGAVSLLVVLLRLVGG